MSQLDELEEQSVYIFREAYKHFKQLCMLWSIGKDSTVLLWLARKAFFGHVPFPLVHIDTSYKVPSMIAYRDRLAREWGLQMIVGQNRQALAEGMSHERGRLTCCRALKTEALRHTLDGSWPRLRMGADGRYHEDPEVALPAAPGREASFGREAFTGVIVGARADEEGSRSKERYFSPRDHNSDWDIADQPPELWNQFKTDFAPGTHVRIHPLLDWTEVNIWEYIERERVPIIDLYFDDGTGHRYRSLGCETCTGKIESTATTTEEILVELRATKVPERAGRAQDQEDTYAMEKLRREGYM
ncbi:sulfate adenylyltransferase subunit CysD [Paraliomyxa miuraensis]|uniref:sulfate adenylyltransferase subunit CysD n=1 Tax=Paraliomyxa miuraensis TaxID=376150 RepID=UPI00224CC50D|nr:sulfate adenylyltransferase subunit CysD [Paraliomyxa miuraensis]MCX4239950.1 sulfate adenylyltransferase subunit 2 [Paraliomyxa miuraensis]